MRISSYKEFYEKQKLHWNEFRDLFIEEFINNFSWSSADYDAEEDIQKENRTRANTHFANFVTKNLNDYITECKAKDEIWKKNLYPFNRMWIVNDDKMKETLKRYSKLLDIINFIDEEGKLIENIKGVSDEDWQPFCKEIVDKTHEIHIKGESPSLVIVDNAFYKRAEEKIGIKKITMQKYLQAFCRLNILIKVGQLKTHGRGMLYIDGYFRKILPTGKVKKERFLNQREHQQALRKFDLPVLTKS